jgi:hypothetical protein
MTEIAKEYPELKKVTQTMRNALFPCHDGKVFCVIGETLRAGG